MTGITGCIQKIELNIDVPAPHHHDYSHHGAGRQEHLDSSIKKSYVSRKKREFQEKRDKHTNCLERVDFNKMKDYVNNHELLDTLDKKIIFHVIYHSQRLHTCFTKAKTFCDLYGVSIPTIRRRFKRLKEAKVLKRERENGTRYHLFLSDDFMKNFINNTPCDTPHNNKYMSCSSNKESKELRRETSEQKKPTIFLKSKKPQKAKKNYPKIPSHNMSYVHGCFNSINKLYENLKITSSQVAHILRCEHRVPMVTKAKALVFIVKKYNPKNPIAYYTTCLKNKDLDRLIEKMGEEAKQKKQEEERICQTFAERQIIQKKEEERQQKIKIYENMPDHEKEQLKETCQQEIEKEFKEKLGKRFYKKSFKLLVKQRILSKIRQT